MSEGCGGCETLRAELEVERARTAELLAENARLHSELAEALRLAELQQADLERYRKAYEDVRPNHPERVPAEQLLLGFSEVLEMFKGGAPVNDIAEAAAGANLAAQKKRKKKKRHAHGRRNALDLRDLETKEVEIIPDEVIAAGGKGFKRIGEETSSRVAFRAASYVHLLIRRVKFVRVEQDADAAALPERATITCADSLESSPVIIAPLPESVWPNVMADPSAIAHVIISKYDDSLSAASPGANQCTRRLRAAALDPVWLAWARVRGYLSHCRRDVRGREGPRVLHRDRCDRRSRARFGQV